MSCLSSIGKASLMYSMDHARAYPSSWSDLAGEYAGNPKLYDCRSNGPLRGTIKDIDLLADFIIVPGLTEDSPPDAVFAYEPLDNHSGRGGNVLFANGAVEWMGPTEHAHALSTINVGHQQSPGE